MAEEAKTDEAAAAAVTAAMDVLTIAASEPAVPLDELWARKHEFGDTEFGMKGMARGSSGGAKCVDASQLREQATVVKHLVKSMHSNFMNGRSIVDVSLPVVIFEPRSFLQRVTDIWQYAPLYLGRAAAVQGDPIERMKLTVSFLVAGMHRAVAQRKPFNPILGETSRARFEDGTDVYVDQPSHHPPVTSFQLFGPGGAWKLHGTHEYTAQMRPPNGLLGGQVGPNTVEFADGHRITYEMPHLKISGIVYGDRVITYQDTLVFRDEASDIRCEVVLNPDGLSGLKSWISSAKSPSDTLRGRLLMGDHEICDVSGSWLEELRFGGKVYWRLGDVEPCVPRLLGEESGEVLPSDARYREDLVALLAGDLPLAEKEKKRLEELQRRDRRLRKEVGAPSSRLEASSSSASSAASAASQAE